jgi:EAL domain-containing protein (putative c-di-GMP-specific phosphodiesterase class I)/GGDEF domain-containing protein
MDGAILTKPAEPDNGAQQRARLLAFAFARADLLIELDRSATITFASGAARWAVDRATDALVGAKLPSLTAPESAGVLRDLHKAFTQGVRFPPQTILFKRGTGASVAASIAGCPMPEMPDRYFLTVAHPYKRTSDLHSGATKRSDETGLLTRESFEAHAKARLAESRQSGEELEMTMLDLAELADFKDRLSEETADTFMRGVGLILKNQSTGGDAAAQIDATKFSVLHTSDVTREDIEKEISSFAKRMDPKGAGIDVLARTLDIDAALLEGEDAGRALVYAINTFASAEAGEFSIAKLSDGLKELVKETVKRVTDFRETLASRGFTLHFQPIVDLRTREVQHQEALTRLPDGRSPFAMVTFAEQTGLVTELDHAVTRQALELLKNDTTIADIAVNISGRSLQSEVFVAALLELLGRYPNVRQRVKIEITESSRIEKLESVGKVVRELQAGNNKVCLDDFGSGSATLHYLRALPVDIVKIDGMFVKDLATNRRDLAMVRSIGSMCRELDMQTVAEFVEDEKQVVQLAECKIQKGQGYLFGKPRPQPYTRSGGTTGPVKASNRSGQWVEWR